MATMRPTSKRIGKSGEEIFVPLEAANAEKPKKRGRRPSHTEHWTKVTVVLFDRQIVFLDRLRAHLRAANGRGPTRAPRRRAPLAPREAAPLRLTRPRSQAGLKGLPTPKHGRDRR